GMKIGLAPVKQVKQTGNFTVAKFCQFADRELPIRSAGIPADERQFAISRAFSVPLQIMLDPRRLSVLVGAENTNIEIVARIFKIVGIAAVKRDLLFRCEDQPDIIVTFIAIKVILAALIKRDHIRT